MWNSHMYIILRRASKKSSEIINYINYNVINLLNSYKRFYWTYCGKYEIRKPTVNELIKT